MQKIFLSQKNDNYSAKVLIEQVTKRNSLYESAFSQSENH